MFPITWLQDYQLKKGLIILSSTLRHAGPIQIMTDNTTGFVALIKQEDKQLKELQIKLTKTDKLNKNANEGG